MFELVGIEAGGSLVQPVDGALQGDGDNLTFPIARRTVASFPRKGGLSVAFSGLLLRYAGKADTLRIERGQKGFKPECVAPERLRPIALIKGRVNVAGVPAFRLRPDAFLIKSKIDDAGALAVLGPLKGRGIKRLPLLVLVPPDRSGKRVQRNFRGWFFIRCRHRLVSFR